MTFEKNLRSPFGFFKPRQSTDGKISQEGEADWSPECAAFRDYWSHLRAGAGVPTSEAFLDAPSPRFARFAFILELLDGAPVVRMQGTQLEQTWARDLTGGDFFPGRSSRFRAAGMANMRAVLSHPCGHLARSSYATSRGRKITSDWIMLPVAVRAGRAPRIVGAVFQHARRGTFSEVGVHHFELHKIAWLDAGWGVPAAPPVPLAD